jgi:cysteinyl-tRNA synthetase
LRQARRPRKQPSMTLRLTNTLTRQKQTFVPDDPRRVTLYVCGPTVYNRAHIGNARPAVVFDVLYRVLRHLFGAQHVFYARNITDIDDKITQAATEQGVPIGTITDRFEKHYLDDMAALDVLPPTFAPHATQHVAQIIALIEQLIAAGHAYEAQGHVLFAVPSLASYGALSGRDRDEMIAGARVDVAPYKRDPADFVLWKPSTPQLPGWDSPWGRGRPGWHIECSAMIKAVFGQSTIDIHGGGQDLIFPHHENEMAQSAGAHGGAGLARFWVHNGFLNMGKDKMSKSLGNIVSVEQLLAQGHKGEVLRLALLSAHYRQPLEWTEELIASSKARLEGLYRRVADAPSGEADAGVLEALCDDLNTPEALARLAKLDGPTLKASAVLMGLMHQSAEQFFRSATGDGAMVDALMAARAAAKAARNWAEADRIRDDLQSRGVVLEDRKDGTTNWRWA